MSRLILEVTVHNAKVVPIASEPTCAKLNRNGHRCGHPEGHRYQHSNGTNAPAYTFDQSDILASRAGRLELAS